MSNHKGGPHLLGTKCPVFGLLFAAMVAATGCDSTTEVSQLVPGPAKPTSLDPSAPTGTSNPPTTTPPAGTTTRTFTTAALVYNGDGAWTSEVANLESVLKSHSLSYQEVTSAQLAALTQDEMGQFGTIIWPGGSGTSMLNSLSGATRIKIRSAVIDQGVSFVGFCAGAFLAVSPAPAAGQAPGYLSLISAPVLDYYYLENQGVTDAMTLESFADGTQHDLVWYGGPVTLNIAGGVVAKYPTGDPAITEAFSGNGFVIISGVHPASPNLGIGDTDGIDLDVAYSLINAALTRTPLRAF